MMNLGRMFGLVLAIGIVVETFVPADGEGSVLIYTQGLPHFFLLAELWFDP